MHRLSSLVSLLILFNIVSASFERASYVNRSADIIIVPENIQDDSFVLLLDSTNTEKSNTNSPIDETQLANLISALVGGPIVNSKAALDQHIVAGHSLFNKAKANLLIFVDGVGSEDIKTDLKIKEKAQNVKLNKVAYPQDSVATISTIITGHSPSVHGIVNEYWMTHEGVQFVAFSDRAGPAIFNIHDQLSQTFEGLPLIVSGSSKYELTAGVGVNRFNTFGNNYNMYWDAGMRSFVNLNGKQSNGLNISRASISVDETLTNREFLFEAELKFIENLMVQLKNKEFDPLVKDSVPDLFSFSVASLKNLKSNPNFETLVQRLDAALVNAVESLSELYNGKINVQIVFLGKSAQEKLAADSELKKKVLRAIGDDVYSIDYFPNIHVHDRANQQSACEKLRKAISNEVFCPSNEANVFHGYEIFAENDTVDGDTNATVFQTILWMSILLSLFVIGAVYAVTTISAEVATDPWLQVREETKEHLM